MPIIRFNIYKKTNPIFYTDSKLTKKLDSYAIMSTTKHFYEDISIRPAEQDKRLVEGKPPKTRKVKREDAGPRSSTQSH